MMNAFTSNKILQHPERIAQWKETGTCVPIVIELDMTNACDNFCPWCFGYAGLKRQDRSTWHKGNVGQRWKLDEAKDILNQIKNFGIKAVTFTGGGEPLVNPWTPEAIVYTKELGLDVGLITNGNKMSGEIAEIVLSNCVWCRFSVDATDSEEYAIEHGVKSWGVLLENIRRMVAIKKKIKSECTVGIGYLTNGRNDDRIMGFARLGSELGVDYAQFRPMLIGWGTKDVSYKSRNTVPLIRAASEKYSTEGYTVTCSEHKYNRIEARQLSRDYDLCHGQHFAAVIAADHKMYVCCHMRGIEKYCIGDLRESTLEEIWYAKARESAVCNINVHSSDCPPLCRADSFNTILWQIQADSTTGGFAQTSPPEQRWRVCQKPVTHENFI